MNKTFACRAAHAVIKKQQCIRTPAKPMLYRPVPSKLDQIAFGFSIKKSGANHFSIRICAALPRKGIFGYSRSQGILDLDRRNVGFITISQQPMIDTVASLSAFNE